MKSWEEQEQDEQHDRRLRKRQRLAAALIGLSVVALTCFIVCFNGTGAGFWGSLNLGLMFPGMFLLLFPPLPLAIHFLARPFHRWITDEIYLMMQCADFIFYTGVSYFLMRLWSSRNDE